MHILLLNTLQQNIRHSSFYSRQFSLPACIKHKLINVYAFLSIISNLWKKGILGLLWHLRLTDFFFFFTNFCKNLNLRSFCILKRAIALLNYYGSVNINLSKSKINQISTMGFFLELFEIFAITIYQKDSFLPTFLIEASFSSE